MFFTGSLQEGIATALQHNKCVFCFVTDEEAESQAWETEYLTEGAIAALLQDGAVALRLKKDSEEAGYLAAIFPLPKTPTVVIIKNGDLKEYITAGTSKDEFVRRVTTAFSGAQGQPAAPQPAAAPAPAPAAQATDDLYEETPSNPLQTAPARPSTSDSSPRGPATPTQEEENAAILRTVLAERAARLEAQRIESERKAKAARAAAAEKAETDNSKQAEQTRNHKAALKKARQDAADEKARILKKIEDDRAERRAKAAERAAIRNQASSPKLGEVAAALTRSESSSLAPSTSSASGMTALQVRLLDGSTIRSRFPNKATLAKDVRTWVNSEWTDGSKEPYRFKVVLAPLPSKLIDDTEESKCLEELSLSPSSTLVLAPVGAHVSAYQGSSLGSMAVEFLLLPLALLQWLWGLISGVFTKLGTSRQAADEGGAEPVTVREQRKGKFSQFANPNDRKNDHQLYNGNSLNFEPRPDEKKDE
ncbi:UBX domain-containing protein [Colletotrichum graminicola]|uniref:UBX domain-containing protein 2 n=1 Tax=Colletotrichum graminicola (strain M1.001 / M2 / FGSC 10212) TaxID=645133 RepID=E3QF86_COLGM|nr:UBX domain-containing protein [Colletotrichum graminicola M1.001]EFQ29524.1 UBX domain-containing protein [Colletotrichum graminicola M1.001]WDK23503.1 UBX domain-containing protein [Colletotrichum graminicola]